MDDSGPNEELEQVVQAVIANDLQVTPQICEVLKKNKGEGLKKLVAKEIAQCFSLRTRAVLTMLWCALEAPNVINFRSMKMEPKEQEKSDDEIEVIYFRSMKMEPMEQEKRNDEIKVINSRSMKMEPKEQEKRDYEVNEEFLKNLMPYDEELQEKIKKDKEYDYRRASLTLAFYDTRDASRDGTFQEQIELILVNFYDQLFGNLQVKIISANPGQSKIPAFVHISENVKEYLRETLPLMTIRVNNGKRRRTAGPFPRSRTEAVIRHPITVLKKRVRRYDCERTYEQAFEKLEKGMGWSKASSPELAKPVVEPRANPQRAPLVDEFSFQNYLDTEHEVRLVEPSSAARVAPKNPAAHAVEERPESSSDSVRKASEQLSSRVGELGLSHWEGPGGSRTRRGAAPAQSAAVTLPHPLQNSLQDVAVRQHDHMSKRQRNELAGAEPATTWGHAHRAALAPQAGTTSNENFNFHQRGQNMAGAPAPQAELAGTSSNENFNFYQQGQNVAGAPAPQAELAGTSSNENFNFYQQGQNVAGAPAPQAQLTGTSSNDHFNIHQRGQNVAQKVRNSADVLHQNRTPTSALARAQLHHQTSNALAETSANRQMAAEAIPAHQHGQNVANDPRRAYEAMQRLQTAARASADNSAFWEEPPQKRQRFSDHVPAVAQGPGSSSPWNMAPNNATHAAVHHNAAYAHHYRQDVPNHAPAQGDLQNHWNGAPTGQTDPMISNSQNGLPTGQHQRTDVFERYMHENQPFDSSATAAAPAQPVAEPQQPTVGDFFEQNPPNPAQIWNYPQYYQNFPYR